MAAFNLGLLHGASVAGVALVIYSGPATYFDWPRVTLTDVIDLLSGIVRGIVGFLASLFDW
jgi:hypothetical protein